MSREELSLVLASISLSKSIGQDFTDIDLSKRLGIQKTAVHSLIQSAQINGMLRKTPVGAIVCPDCGQTSKRTVGTEAICKECGTAIDDSGSPDYMLLVNVNETEAYLKNSFTGLITTQGFSVAKSSDGYFSLSKGPQNLSVLVACKNAGMKEYYALRGWANPQGTDMLLLLCSSADSELIATAQKDPRCMLFSIMDMGMPDFLNALSKALTDRVRVITQLSEAERAAELNPTDMTKDIFELRGKLDEMLAELPALALQSSTGTAPAQGRKFQKYILTLLNMSFFRAKSLTGGNEPDGLIQLFRFSNQKTTWIPIEIKTFKPNGAPSISVSEFSTQLDRYSAAFNKDNIHQFVETPDFLIIANDFVVGQAENDIINGLEQKYRMHYSLMPLSTLVYMFKKYIEKQPAYIDPDLLQAFIHNARYIGHAEVDQLLKQLAAAKRPEDGILQAFRQNVKSKGK